jgi:HSP20 family protein
MFLVPVTRRSSDFSRQLERLFDDSFERLFNATEANEPGQRSPALDVSETERGYTVKLDLPGVVKEDVQVSVEGRRVSVQAVTKREEERKDGERVLYRERSLAQYARSFTLPTEVDQGDASARLENGVLTLTLPKRAARTASQIAIN